MPGLNLVPPTDTVAPSEAREDGTPRQEHRFGLTPEKTVAIPKHLRTSSTQVEPATPPKWLTEQEAEEKAQRAADPAKSAETGKVEIVEKGGKVAEVEKVEKERPTSKSDLAVVRKGGKKERPTGERFLS